MNFTPPRRGMPSAAHEPQARRMAANFAKLPDLLRRKNGSPKSAPRRPTRGAGCVYEIRAGGFLDHRN